MRNGESMSNMPKWYDSHWLDIYIAAKQLVARVAPDRLAEFVAAFDPLRTDPAFKVKSLPRVFDAELITHIRETIKAIPKSLLEMHEVKDFGRFVVHDFPAFTELQHRLVDRVSNWAGEAVEPRYNFLAMYTRRGICDPHLDAPFAKWTLDICVDQSEPWPIHFSNIVPWPEEPDRAHDEPGEVIRSRPDLAFRSVVLNPGDAILFSGSSQWHYRDALSLQKGQHFCDLLFLHYIPKGSSELVLPRNWAKLFGISELATLLGIDDVG